MLIGVTGQIGAGKSEVARILEGCGGYVISADRIGRDVVRNNPKVLRGLVSAFGCGILTPKGNLGRRRLALIAFSKRGGKEKLDAIIHPPLLRELERQVKEASGNIHLVVIDAALLVDWGWQRKVDYTILVHAGRAIRIRRLLHKGYKLIDIEGRMESQLKYEVLRKQADIVIMNNKSLEALRVRVTKIVEKLARKG